MFHTSLQKGHSGFMKLFRLFFCLTIYFLSAAVLAETVAQPPIGNGTDQPYQISNLAELRWVSETPTSWDKNFVITANIDATETSTWNGGLGFSPVGHSTNKFTGSFNNQGTFVISNLTINRPTEENIGLFGYVQQTTIQNLRLKNLNVIGAYSVGGLIGYAYYDTTISNCYTKGNVTSNSISDSLAGGIVGGIDEVVLSNCYSECNVTSTANLVSFTQATIGGLSGYSYNATITDCFATGNIISNADICESGGLIGYTTNTTVTNCFATGDIT